MDGTTGGWFDREITGCSLVDRRLEKRLRSLLERLGHAMGASIPLACQDWAKTKAAYRFFSNERISKAAILAGHFAASFQALWPAQFSFGSRLRRQALRLRRTA